MRYPDSKISNPEKNGGEFEDFVMRQMLHRKGIVIQVYQSRRYQLGRGESIQGFEIKLDQGHLKYGHLSIEIAERTNLSAPWVESGIFKKDNAIFYIQGNSEKFYLFVKRDLVRYFRDIHPAITEKHGTVRTFYLPHEYAEELCIWRYPEEHDNCGE